MPRLIGEAYVAIVADSAGFQAEAQSGIRRALAAVDATKAVGADTAPFLAKVEAAKRAVLSNGEIQLLVGADVAPAGIELASLRAATADLRARLAHIPVSTDNGRFIAQLVGMEAALAAFDKRASKLAKKNSPDSNAPQDMVVQFARYEDAIKQMEIATSHIDASMNIDDAVTQMAKFRVMVEVTVEELAKLKLNPNDLEGQLKMQRMFNEAMALSKELRSMTADMDAGPMKAKILGLTIEAAALQKELSGVSDPLSALGTADVITSFEAADKAISQLGSDVRKLGNGKASVAALGNAVRDLSAEAAVIRAKGFVTTADLDRVRQLTADLNTAQQALARISPAKAAGGLGVFGAIAGFFKNTHIPLFASQMTVASKDADLLARGLTILGANFLTTASGVHIATEAVVELAAVWGPAILGVSLFSAAAIPTLKQVQAQFQNSKTVAEANKSAFNDVAAGMGKISQAAQPKVLMLWGYYMDAAGRSSGHLADIVTSVGTVIDGFAQRLDNALTSKQGGTFLNKAAQDIQGLGNAFASVGSIAGSLVSVMPGYAEMLLKVGDAALKAAAGVVQFIKPALGIGLALHGGIFYAGLASTILLTFGRSAVTAAAQVAMTGDKAVASGGKLSTWGTAVGNAAGALIRGGQAAFNWARSTGSAVKAAEGLGGKLRALSAAANFAQWGPWALAIGVVGGAMLLLAANTGIAADQAKKLHDQLQGAINASNIASIQGTIADSIKTTTAAIDQQAAAYAKASTPTAGALGLIAQQQGVRMQFRENTAALQQYVGEFGTAGTRLAALTNQYGSVTAAMQLMNIAGVNQGDIASATDKQWQADLHTLQVAAAAYAFMGQSVGTTGAQLSALSISTGNTTAALQNLTSAEQQWISISTGGEAAFTAFAQGMQTLSGQLGTQQQQASQVIGKNGKLVTTYQNVTASLNGLNSASLTARASYQSQISSAITLYGALQTLNAAAGATPKSIAQLGISAKAIVGTFLSVASTSGNATIQLYDLAQSLGYTGKATISGLAAWAGYTPTAKGAAAATKALDGAQQALAKQADSLTQAAKNLGNALQTDITASQAQAILSSSKFNSIQTQLYNTLGKTHNQVTKNASVLIGQYYQALVQATGSTGLAKQETDAFLKALGLTDGQIQTVNHSLDQLASKLNALPTQKTIYVNVVTRGTVNYGTGNPVAPLPHGAAGGIVRGGGASGRDSILAVLAPGELVIPTSHAPAFQEAAKRAGVPGLALGGMATPVGSFRPSALVTGGFASTPNGGSMMQPQTSYQGQQLIQLMQQAVRLLQQQPQQFGNVINQGNGNGVRSAFFTAHS